MKHEYWEIKDDSYGFIDAWHAVLRDEIKEGFNEYIDGWK